MSSVVKYRWAPHSSFCQIRFDTGERVRITVASAPEPSIKVVQLALRGLLTRQTVWEYGPRAAGGHDAYTQNLLKIFPQSSRYSDYPLDPFRDPVLRCGSVNEVRRLVLDLEDLVYVPEAAGSQLSLEAARDLVAAYGQVLEQSRETTCSEDTLPGPKDEVKSAILKVAVEGRQSGTVSEEVIDNLRAVYGLLSQFVPPDEAEIVQRFHGTADSSAAISDLKGSRLDDIVDRIGETGDDALRIMRSSIDEFESLIAEFDAAMR
jgi:hypothetical protein